MKHALKNLALSATVLLSASVQAGGQIDSPEKLTAYLQIDAARTTPLDALDAGDKQRFLSSLVFTAHGLASFNASALSEATPTQKLLILDLFGAASALPGMSVGRIKTPLDREIVEVYSFDVCDSQGPIGGGYSCPNPDYMDGDCKMLEGNDRRFCVGPSDGRCNWRTCR